MAQINYGWLTSNDVKFAPKTTTNQVYYTDGLDLSSKLDGIIESIPQIPDVTTDDNGKVLQVVDGSLAFVELSYSKIYVGDTEPTSDLGNDNDLYIQVDPTEVSGG